MINVSEQAARPATSRDAVLHSPCLYDLLVFVATRGRESAFRQKIIDLARLKPGESALDVGCGTGTLAIAARRRVGRDGKVSGIDASPEMIARAGKKAKKAGFEIDFRNESIEALPFPDARFDAVLSTVMLHHLPRKVREAGIREIRRVLKPGGRVLIVDSPERTGKPASRASSSTARSCQRGRGNCVARGRGAERYRGRRHRRPGPAFCASGISRR